MNNAEGDETVAFASSDADAKELLGLFDLPAFARRGQELEGALESLRLRLEHKRSDMLAMVRIRLKMWASESRAAEDWKLFFRTPEEDVWLSAGVLPPAERKPRGNRRKLQKLAKDLEASALRFNRLWIGWVESLELSFINNMIDSYNRYYILEKECVVGSWRIASRGFETKRRLTTALLLEQHPPLPELKSDPPL